MMKKYTLLIFSLLLFFNCSKDDEIIIAPPEVAIETVYILPVVVHVIHSGEVVGDGFNLSKERIINQLKTLNDDFRKKEGTLGYNTHPLGTDAKIEFKFAEIDPEGNPTDGITRVNYNNVATDSSGGWLFDNLPNYGYWNKLNYINIWVYPFEPNIVLGQSSVPFVDLPGLNDANPNGTTGILITTPHFGESDVIGGSNLGRTLTHEMGHFLGLEHLWGKIENANCTDFDDYCEDTPAVSRRSGNCDGAPTTSCTGEKILTQNYMDYTNDACMNMFTRDQVLRMRYVLEKSSVRESLISAPVLNRDQ
jgi:hypothetical protein